CSPRSPPSSPPPPPPILEELRRAASAADADAGKRAAHSLKGSCRTMGADFMATLAADLEQSPATDPAQLDRLVDAFARTGEVLQAQCSAGGRAVRAPARPRRDRAVGAGAAGCPRPP